MSKACPKHSKIVRFGPGKFLERDESSSPRSKFNRGLLQTPIRKDRALKCHRGPRCHSFFGSESPSTSTETEKDVRRSIKVERNFTHMKKWTRLTHRARASGPFSLSQSESFILERKKKERKEQETSKRPRERVSSLSLSLSLVPEESSSSSTCERESSVRYALRKKQKRSSLSLSRSKRCPLSKGERERESASCVSFKQHHDAESHEKKSSLFPISKCFRRQRSLSLSRERERERERVFSKNDGKRRLQREMTSKSERSSSTCRRTVVSCFPKHLQYVSTRMLDLVRVFSDFRLETLSRDDGVKTFADFLKRQLTRAPVQRFNLFKGSKIWVPVLFDGCVFHSAQRLVFERKR